MIVLAINAQSPYGLSFALMAFCSPSFPPKEQEDVEIVEDVDVPSAIGNNIADNGLRITDLSDMGEALSQYHISGNIAGVLHVAANTCGDGACGLHSLFGQVSASQLILSLIHI